MAVYVAAVYGNGAILLIQLFPQLILVWSKMQRNNTLQTVDLPLVIAPTVIAARDAGVLSGSPWYLKRCHKILDPSIINVSITNKINASYW